MSKEKDKRIREAQRYMKKRYKKLKIFHFGKQTEDTPTYSKVRPW